MQSVELTGDWQQIASGKEALIVSVVGVSKLFIGQTAPAADARGLTLVHDYPYSVPNLNTYGGGAWIKGTPGQWCDYVTD